MPPRCRTLRALLVVCSLVLGGAAPAHAARLTVVGPAGVTVRDDPFVPVRAQSDVGPVGPLEAARDLSAAAQARGASRRPPPGARAVARALRRAREARRLGRARYLRYRRLYRRARFVARRIHGARARQLGYVVAVVDRMASSGRLISSRMPALFLLLRRNLEYWPRRPYPRAGDRIAFRGSELLFQYYPDRGLQLQPLASFKKANLMHAACVSPGRGPCRPWALRRLLDEASRLATPRGRGFIAWEYMFDFGGGAPPWMSAMAQATGLVALARGSRLLGEPRYLRTARRALGAFAARPPAGVRTRGPYGGVHYLQYSFAPRLYVFNAFLASVAALHDVADLANDERATRLSAEAHREARREVPASDVGDWSRYSFRGRESTPEYHELLREVLQGLCERRLGRVFCDYAVRYRGYQTEPPVVRLRGPRTVREEARTRIAFELSKLSAVELTVSKGERAVLRRSAALRRGRHYFTWRPRSAGAHSVRLAARELRTGAGLRTATSATVEVEDDPAR